MTIPAILGPRVGGVGRVGAVTTRRRRGSRRSMRGTALRALRPRWGALLTAALALSACIAWQSPTVVSPTGPGFWQGLWHGFILPVAWVGSLFSDTIAVYAVPNSGGWYDFGYILGIMLFGVGGTRIASRRR